MCITSLTMRPARLSDPELAGGAVLSQDALAQNPRPLVSLLPLPPSSVLPVDFLLLCTLGVRESVQDSNLNEVEETVFKTCHSL